MSEDEKKRIMRMIEQEDSSDEDDDSDLKEGQNSTSQKLNKEGKAGA